MFTAFAYGDPSHALHEKGLDLGGEGIITVVPVEILDASHVILLDAVHGVVFSTTFAASAASAVSLASIDKCSATILSDTNDDGTNSNHA